ncbi:MAG: porin family protein [Acidobacteria bacterium]|nr:porin family protein [Acidobacteriota bacterium]
MSTTRGCDIRRLGRRWLLVIVCTASGAAELWAQPAPELPRMVLSVATGISLPVQEPFRELYGNAPFPVAAQAEYGLLRHLRVFGGFRFFHADGETPVDPDFAPESYSLELRMYSVRFGASAVLPLRSLRLSAGAGAGYHAFRETWREPGFSHSARALGFIAQAGVEYPLSTRFALIGRVEYNRIPAKGGADPTGSLNLGSLDLLAGLAFCLY